MNDVKITKVEPVDGSIYKGYTNCGEGFIMDVNYTLADGRVFKGHVSSRRKKDVHGSLESERKSIAAGAMDASFNQDGKFFGTVRKFVIGGAGMVPLAS